MTMAVNGGPVSVPEVVGEALRVTASRQGFRQPRFHVEAGSKPGEGYMSVLYRATVEEEEASLAAKTQPLRLMCKMTTPGTQGTMLMNRVFMVEGCMYNTVLPAMEDIAGFKEPLPWPSCHLASVDGPPPHYLVLGDLRPDGFVMADRSKPFDLAHCRFLVRQLARYHGAGMALQHLRPDDFNAMKEKLSSPMEMATEMKAMLMPFLTSGAGAPAMVTDRFPEGGPVHTKLKKMFTNFPDFFFECMVPDPEGGNTIVHGDCHLNNVLFQYNKASGAVTGCRLIDFQASRFGIPTPDLCQLLLPSTEKALRDAHWDELLHDYHRELQATLRTAGCRDPDAIYSWKRFQAQLRVGYEYALCVTPMMLHGLAGGDDAVKEIQDMVSQFVGEPKTEASPKKHEPKRESMLKESPFLKQRFGDVVQNLIEWGYL